MTVTRQLTFTNPDVGKGNVTLDDTDITYALRHITVRMGAGDDYPHVTLDLARISADITINTPHIKLEPVTHELLTRLGWTPPNTDTLEATP